MTKRELITKILEEGDLDSHVLVRALKRTPYDALESYKVIAIEKVNNYSGHGTCIDVCAREVSTAKSHT